MNRRSIPDRPPRGGRRIILLAAFLLPLARPAPAHAQMGGQRPIAIKNATVWTLAGEPIEGANILVAGKKIRAVGRDVRIPPFARVIDAGGKTVIPGLVDARSTLGLTPPPRASGRSRPTTRVTSRAVDGIDPFERHQVEEALRNGVTTVFVAPHGSSGLFGTGAVVRLDPSLPAKKRILQGEGALCGALGAGRSMLPIRRLKELKALRALLKGAKSYGESWDEYRENLEEYEKKITERREKKKTEESPAKKEPKKKGPEKKKPENKTPEKKTPPKKSAAGKEKLKKPKEPKIDRSKELLVRALEGKIPVRLEVHRAEDILNALELNEEYPLDLILEGVTEGYKVKSALAESGVRVIVEGTVRDATTGKGKFRGHDPANPAILHEAGIPLAIASGPGSPSPTRFLWLAAALAASHGMEPEAALAAVTRDAAKLLGVGDRIGTIEKGKDADLVILSGPPFSGASLVETVLVAGRIVYERTP